MCNYIFNTNTDLSQHKKLHVPNEDYACLQYGFTIDKQVRLDEQMKLLHGKKTLKLLYMHFWSLRINISVLTSTSGLLSKNRIEICTLGSQVLKVCLTFFVLEVENTHSFNIFIIFSAFKIILPTIML